MIGAESVEAAMQETLLKAEPPPRPKPLRIALPADLRNAMLPDLPRNITLEPGRLEVPADTAVAMLESLATLAMIMGNGLDRFQKAIELPRHHAVQDQEISDFLTKLRHLHDRARLGCATNRPS